MPGTNERISHVDPETGVKILQVTSFPTIHYHQYLYGQWIAPNAKSFLLFAYREVKRSSPIDLWRVNADGTDLALLVEGASWSSIDSTSTTVYSGCGTSIVRAPLAGGKPEEIVRLPEGAGWAMVCAISPDDRFLFIHARGNAGHAMYHVDLTTGEAKQLMTVVNLMHLQIAPPDRLLANMTPPGMTNGVWTCSFDGDDFRKLPFTRSTNHFAALGATGKVVTTVHSGGCAVELATPGGEKSDVIAQGPGFWHPTSDASGEWVAADTNWPDTGMHLVHMPSGRFAKVCTTGASGGHPQWTHAHPRFAPDASYIVYDSDRTGICQVYIAFLPDEMKDRLRKG